MRCFQWAVAAAIAFSCTACSKETPPAPPAQEAQASAPALAPAVAEAEPEAATEASATAPPVSELAATPSAAPAPPVQHIVQSRERRIRALLNNAIARDVTGETEHEADVAAARRAACRTQACVNQSYAAQEASLRRWEGSEDIH